jgi:SAM-dependent methyltransferase
LRTKAIGVVCPIGKRVCWSPVRSYGALMTHPGHHAGHHQHDGMFDSPEAAAANELEGDVLIGFVDDATSVLDALCDAIGLEVRRVLDLGSGPGVGSCVLAERFGEATVIAADGSPAMLDRAVARAARLGFADRVEVRHVDLASDIGTLAPADLVWASMSLHHVGDELAALREIRQLLEPGGLVALIERHAPTRVLPDGIDLGRPGIWERLDAAWADWFTDMRADLPGSTESAGYPSMLAAAGFDVVADQVLAVSIDEPLDDAGRRFALKQMTQSRGKLDGRADPADLSALDALLDQDAPDGIMHRDDVRISATRRLYVGRAR